MADTLTITDNRTGKQYEIPVTNGTIRAMDLRQIKVDPDEFGMMSYDPAYLNTVSCTSRITFIDGGKGILRYRGYPIEQLAEHSTFVETAYLLLNGELPTAPQLSAWEAQLSEQASLPPTIQHLVQSFGRDAHPMSVLISALGALSALHPEAKEIFDEDIRRTQITRLIADVPGIAAYVYRHRRGLPLVEADPSLGFVGNFLKMLHATDGSTYKADPVLERALDILFILHADHEQNCSTSTMRGIGSSQADPFASLAGAAAALFGPLHGGANEAVLRMLAAIGTVDKIPAFVKQVKDGEGRLMGFGHRVYKSYDPRATVIKEQAYRVFEVTGKNPLLDVAIELERIALQDDYFVSRRLYPNVDFYSGLIYQAMGFKPDMFPVLFAIGRTPGWVSQWQEMLGDKEQKIMRPRQVYKGADERDYLPMAQR